MKIPFLRKVAAHSAPPVSRPSPAAIGAMPAVIAAAVAAALRKRADALSDEDYEKVVRINLAASTVTDEDLASVARLNALQELYLSGTQVGDAGLAHLQKLNALKWLYLGGTQVSDEGKKQLGESLPGCTIY